MKSATTLASLALLLASAFGAAQGFSQVSASSGSVTGKGSTGGWEGLGGSASTATIGYVLAGANVTPPNALKFATTPSGVQGKDLPGFATAFPGGFASSQGASAASAPGAGSSAPVYYTAGWTANLFSAGTQTGGTDSGTFDPYDVRYGDVSPLTGGTGGTVDLYFQSALGRGGSGGGTFLFGSDTTVAEYTYGLYVTDAGGVRTDILSLGFSTATGLDIDFNPNSGLDLFLLGNNANDTSTDPDRRTAAGIALRDPRVVDGLLASFFNPDGSLIQDLNFGVRRQLTVAPTGNANEKLFSWHVDTTNRVEVVPEPASLAVLSLGAMALLRRRKRA